MKLIVLNLQGGVVYEPLIEFIKKVSSEIDVFCFQEVMFGNKPEFTPRHKARINLFSELKTLLPEFIAYENISISGHFQKEPIDFGAGQAIFVGNSIKVNNHGGLQCYDKVPELTNLGGRMTGNMEWIDIEINGLEVTIGNLHGLWQYDTYKIDTPERLLQSERIKKFFDSKNGKKIISGDFNLIPDGKSMKILEQGMINLISKFNITSTRSSFYTKSTIRLADYMLVSPDIKVVDFKVLQDEVSDHLPLYLEFE